MDKCLARIDFIDGTSIEVDRNTTHVPVVQDNGEPKPQTLANVEVDKLVILHDNIAKSVRQIVNLRK